MFIEANAIDREELVAQHSLSQRLSRLDMIMREAP